MSKLVVNPDYIKQLEYYGGTITVTVDYTDFDVINIPRILFNGTNIINPQNYLNPSSMMTPSLDTIKYTYVFDFPATTAKRDITIIFNGTDMDGVNVVRSIEVNQKAYEGVDIQIPTEYYLSENEVEINSTNNSIINMNATIKSDLYLINVGRVEVYTNADWITVTEKNINVETYQYYKATRTNYEISFNNNIEKESRVGIVKFYFYDSDGNTKDVKEMVVIQNGTVTTNNIEYYSEWEDIIFRVDGDVFNYKVVEITYIDNSYSKESTIFEGRAYKYPDADNIEIKLNPIIFNYLNNSLVGVGNGVDFNNTINTELRNYNACKRFRIFNRDTNELLIEYRVLYDNSYKLRWRGNEEDLSLPINNDYAINMIDITSRVSKLGIVYNKFNNTLTPNKCGDYALYYLNNRGGWDTLLVNTKVNKSKNINYFTTERYAKYLNLDFEQYRYISELQNSYEINTGFLSNEQSTNAVENLLTSNEVYLHNLKENIVYSVIITDTNVKYKYYNDSMELPYYIIKIKESQIQLKH